MRQHNMFVQLPELCQQTEVPDKKAELEDSWCLLISEDIIDNIVRWTDIKIGSLETKFLLTVKK